MEAINYSTASLVDNIFIKDPLECIDISAWNFCFINLEMNLGAFQARRISELKVQKTLIEDITSTVTFPKEDVNASSVKHENICSNSSSVFKTLENISRLASPLDTETNRSYLDIMNFSQTTAGCASIGKIHGLYKVCNSFSVIKCYKFVLICSLKYICVKVMTVCKTLGLVYTIVLNHFLV